MKFKNINSVLFLAASLAAGHVAAQSTHFSGWSAALGGSVVDGNLKINELNQGQAGNLGRTKIVATFDAGYSMPLNDKWALGMGNIEPSEAWCKGTAERGDLAMLQWLRVHQEPPCPWSEAGCMSIAAARGHLSVVQWLHEQGAPLLPSRVECSLLLKSV